MTVLLAILGVLIGALAAVVLLRRDSRRLREELKAISVDVLEQTGDSLARSVAESRRAEQERAAGEMAQARPSRSRALVEPVQEKLGSMESEIGRLERERSQAQGELAQMVRQLGEGVGTLRQRDRQPRLRAASGPRRAAPGARSSCATSSRWPAWSRTATSSSRARSRPTTGALRPDMLVRLPGRQADRGRLEGAARRLPDGAGGRRRGRARAARSPATPADARAHRQARLQGLPAPVRLDARVRRDVRALRRHLPGRARRGPGADRVRRRSSRC